MHQLTLTAHTVRELQFVYTSSICYVHLEPYVDMQLGTNSKSSSNKRIFVNQDE